MKKYENFSAFMIHYRALLKQYAKETFKYTYDDIEQIFRNENKGNQQRKRASLTRLLKTYSL